VNKCPRIVLVIAKNRNEPRTMRKGGTETLPPLEEEDNWSIIMATPEDEAQYNNLSVISLRVM